MAVINGTSGNDILNGGAQNDIIIAGNGNDILNSNGGNDLLQGENGNDVLNGGIGIDTMNGGSGNDTYVVDNIGDIVTEGVGSDIDTVQSSITYTLGVNLENLSLTGTANINGTGNIRNNIIRGNSGNNIINGGGGIDTLIGGAGNDIYIVDTTTDRITENLNQGIDRVNSSVSYTLGANLENLTLTGIANINGTGNTLNNTIIGNSGNNVLNGGGGNDTLIGGVGNDTYNVNSVGDVVGENLSQGTDTVISTINYTLGANVENLTLSGAVSINGTGNSLNNILRGNTANNILTGGGGNDTLNGNGGIDTLIGGTGNDTYSITNTTTNIVENLNQGTDTVSSTISYTLGANLENLTLTGTANINGTGNSLNNIIRGNSGSNTINGGGGLDTLIGGAGNDIYIFDTTDRITENLNQGIDRVNSSVSYSLGANLENLTLTGIANINGTGNSGNNTIRGNNGDNVLNGGGGIDALIGGAGNDAYYIDTITDIITETLGQGFDTVISSVTYTLGANLDKLILNGSANINATGNDLNNVFIGNAGTNIFAGGDGNDRYVLESLADTIVENSGEGLVDEVYSRLANYTLGDNLENLTLTGIADIYGFGNSFNNVITGNAGNNILDGGGGIDTLIGGDGDDIYYIDTLTDTITENLEEGIDTIVSYNASYTLGTNLDNLILGDNIDFINPDGIGNILDNVITGNGDDNFLDGGDGDDILDGGVGNDFLVGGIGADQFLFDQQSPFDPLFVGIDVIDDFAQGIDKIVLDQTTFTFLSNNPSEFTTVVDDFAAEFENAAIVFSQGTGNLFYNTNGTAFGFGDGGQFATVSNVAALNSSDFMVVP